MSDVQPDPNQEIPLTPAVFHILLALADGEKHGYAIMKEVEEATAGTVTMDRARSMVPSSACCEPV